MSNNNRKKTIIIDALSNIKDETLDKATEKRIGWINSMRKRKNKRRIAVMAPIAAVVVILTLLTVILIPILGRKQVPVYTGMTVSGAVDESVALQNPEDHVVIRQDENGISITPLTKDPVFLAGNGNNGSNGNHYGNGNGNGNQAIPKGEAAEKAENLLNSAESAENIYYARANEDIYITVHVDNPDSFEILSFTLNGNKYSSYMFEKGSDLENLILKVNVGDAEGTVEYTLDNIKYVDGTEIKDARLEGNRTVTVGVYTERQPSVSVSNVEMGMYGVKAKVALNDPVGLLALSNCTPMAVVYDGENIVGSQELVLGNNDIDIDMLTPESYYKLAIVAKYDRYDGNGIDTYTLYESGIRTKGVLSLDIAELTQTGISFSYLWNDGEGQVVSSELFLGDEKICDITGDGIDGLLSGVTYRVVVVFIHNGMKNTAEYEFTTIAKTEPSYKITSDTVTQSSVSVNIEETDIDGIGTVTSVELLHGDDDPISAEPSEKVTFNGISSASTYTVRVTYTYDLNDGNGIQTEIKEITVVTPTKGITVTDVRNVDGKNAVFPGESVMLVVFVDNPDGVNIDGFVINGVTVVAKKATGNSYSVNYISDSTGGREYFEVTEIKYSVDRTSFTLDSDYLDSDYLTVICEVSVEKVELKGGKNRYGSNEDVVCVVTLKGAEDYDVMKINDYTSLTKLSDSTYSFVLNGTGQCSFAVTSVTYGDGGQTVTKSVKSDYVAYVKGEWSGDNTVIDISTPEQLQNMQGGKKYRLANNIDLAGFNWTPITGIDSESNSIYLDGNGKTIKNLNIYVIITETSSTEIGMFSRFGGTIKDLTITDVSVTVINTTDRHVNVGLLAGYTGSELPAMISVYNSHIDGKITYVSDKDNFTAGIISGSSVWPLPYICNNTYDGVLEKMDSNGISVESELTFAYVTDEYESGYVNNVKQAG